MGLPPISFSGFSDFSDSFQTILERTFTVSNLPKLNLETEKTVLEGRQAELSALRSDLLALHGTFTSLGFAGAQGAVTASSSDDEVASVSVNGTVSPGSYEIDVTSAAAAAQEATLTGLADFDTTALAGDGIYKLTLGGTTTTIDTAVLGIDNTLEGLRDHLNSDSSLGVSAAIINTSSDPDNPSYHLTITADETGGTTLRLDDSADQNLLTAANQGSDAVFELNGLNVANSSNVIPDFAPGLSLSINGAGTTTISAGDDLEVFREQFRAFAVNYNTVVARLNAQIGEDAGVLSGDTLIRETKQALRDIAGYVSGSGDVRSMAALGLELSDSGLLTFDEVAFNAVGGRRLRRSAGVCRHDQRRLRRRRVRPHQTTLRPGQRTDPDGLGFSGGVHGRP